MVSPEPINQLNLLLWFLCRRPFIQLSVLSPRAKMHAPIFRIAALDNVKFIHVVCALYGMPIIDAICIALKFS